MTVMESSKPGLGLEAPRGQIFEALALALASDVQALALALALRVKSLALALASGHGLGQDLAFSCVWEPSKQ